MPLSLTDQLFGTEATGGKDEPVSLTNQLFGPLTSAPTTAAPAIKETGEHAPTVFEQGMDVALNRSVEEYDTLKTNLIDKQKFKSELSETLKGYAGLATQPYEVIRGAADFIASLPGFGLGLINAAQYMTMRMASPFNLQELYEAASHGMAEGTTWWHKHINEPLIEPTPESQLVGSTAMAPALALSKLGNALADSKRFENYPNLQGLLRFAGDVGGLVALGRIYKGGKGELSSKAEKVTNKAREIADKEKAVEETSLSEAVRRAQERAIEVEKQQLELEAQKVQENLDYGKMVKEDLGAASDRISRAKGATGVGKLPKKLTLEEQFEEGKLFPEKKGKAKAKPKKIEPESEATTDLDLQTGAKTPEALEFDNHPLTHNKEKAQQNYEKIFRDTTLEDLKTDPLLALGKLVNDVNRWRYGERGIDIELTRNRISELAENVDVLKKLCETAEETALFEELARDAGSWARRADRLKIERTGPTETQLNTMIPVNEIPTLVRDFITSSKKLMDMYKRSRMRDFYRNEDIWRETGWWLGRDRNWRYELDDSKMRFKIRKPLEDVEVREMQTILLEDIIDHPELFREFPDIGFTRVEPLPPGVSGVADYLPPLYGERLGRIRVPFNVDPSSIRESFIHEIQHAVQYKVGGTFTGASPQNFAGTALLDTLTSMREVSKNETVGALIDAALEDVRKGNSAAAYRRLVEAPKSLDKSNASVVKTVIDAIHKRAVELYKEVPGEIESRVTEARLEMNPSQRQKTPPWKTLDIMMLAEEKPKRVGEKLYSIEAAAGEAVVKAAKKFDEYTKKARGIKEFKPAIAAELFKEEMVRSFVDRSGNIRKEFLDKLGEGGYEIIQKMYLAKGASSLSTNMLRQMRKEVYDGLTRGEKKILDDLILAHRMIDIGKYKTKKEFKFPPEIDPKSSAIYAELFGEMKGLSAKKVADIRRRAEAYYEWMKRPLKDMLDEQLITKEEYDLLVSHNYRRIKLAEIYDRRYEAKVGPKKRTVYDSGVEALARGRETDIFEPSSEVMALEVFNRAYGRMLNNRAGLSLLDLARRDKENPFVRVKEAKGDRIPHGWNRIFVFEEGTRKPIYLSPELSKEWIISNPEMSYRLSQFIRYASGSVVLRTFATGINWGFALANVPRDVMHLWYAARVFEGGKWKNVYSPHAPVFGLQISHDLATVFLDAATKGKRYNEYMKDGGGMEFLVHQGRILQRGRHLEGPLDTINDWLGYFGETSEVMTRLAIRERVIRRRAKERGISVEEASKDKDIKREATFAARDYMDFGQGGGIAKAADNGIPYLNAAIQGTRGLLRSFSQNPISSTYKLAQFATAVTGIYVAARSLAPKAMEALQGSVDMENNLCIPLGDWAMFEDDMGQTRYVYLKIPLDPGQKFFKTFFEAATDKWLGYDVDIDRVVDSLKSTSPVGVGQLPPSISGSIGYMTNKDFWLNEDIWRRTEEPFDWPRSKEEFVPGQTPQAYIDVGKLTGLSPERTRYAVEELVTSGTVWSYLVGKGYEELFGDFPDDKKEQHIAMTLAKTPVVKRFIGVTHPYSTRAARIEEHEEASELNRWIERRELDRLADGYLHGEGVERDEVLGYIRSFKDREVRDRLVERFKFKERIKDLSNRSYWLRLRSMRPEARAREYLDLMKGLPEEEKDRMRREEFPIVDKAGGVLTEDFRREVRKLQGEE